MEQHEFLTTREVASLLRVKERKVYELAAAGDLPCRRLTGKLLFPRDKIESLLTGETGTTPKAGPAPTRPNVLVGSHDPLLDWALRESGSGIAAFYDGSLDGLDRFARGEGIACGLHVFEPAHGTWNLEQVRSACGGEPDVLLQWAHRRQGLIVATDCAADVTTVADLRGRRVAMRQATAGGRILFEHVLAEAGLSVDELDVTPSAARTESEIAAAVAGGAAEAAFGLEAMARQFRLGFVPMIEERFDLLVSRRAYFEPPLQTLFAFCRGPAFATRAAELSGYDVSGLGIVHWNGP